jgi:hypothetical protein
MARGVAGEFALEHKASEGEEYVSIRALFDHLVGARRAFETGLRRACFDLSDGGALGLTLRSGARVQLDLILLPHDSREIDRSTNRFHRSGCRYTRHT